MSVFARIQSCRNNPHVEALESRCLLSAAFVGQVSESPGPGASDRVMIHAAAAPPFVDLVTKLVRTPAQLIASSGHSKGEVAAVRVVNTGNVVARGSVVVGFYLSSNSTLDAGAVLAAPPIHASIKLKPEQSRVFAAHLRLPTGVKPGSYTLFASALPTAGIRPLHPVYGVTAAARQVLVQSSAGLPGGLHRGHHGFGLLFYSGPAFSIVVAAADGVDDTAAPLPGDDSQPPPVDGPTTQPSTSPSSQPSDGPATVPSDGGSDGDSPGNADSGTGASSNPGEAGGDGSNNSAGGSNDSGGVSDNSAGGDSSGDSAGGGGVDGSDDS